MSPELDLSVLLGSLAIFLVIGVAFYVYAAVVLRILARKTGTPDAWMAWVPILNMVLLCRIGGRSPAAIIGLLIPLVNLIVLVYIFLGIARARRKPAIAAYLMLVPVVNLIVMAWLASGDATSAPASAYEAPAYAPPSYTPPAAGPPTCPHCGDTLDPDERFCGGCGQPAVLAPPPVRPGPYQQQPPIPPQPVQPQPAGKSSNVLVGVLSVVLAAGGGWYGFTRFLSPHLSGSSGQSGAAPAQRASGTLAEFPVDNHPGKPAKPVSVSAMQLRPRPQSAKTAAPPPLPPGITPETLAVHATAITTATYQADPDDPPVTVHVLEAPEPEAGEASLADAVAQQTGDEPSGVQVKTPTGQIYRGHKIRSGAGSVVYTLAKIGAATLVLIYSPEAAGEPIAERLAANIGNGAGLYDYAGVPGAVILLPPPPPAGLTLVEMTSSSGAELANLDELGRSLGTEIDTVKRYIPDRVITARYTDQSRREWKLMAGDFGGSARAWLTWSLLRWASGMQPVSLPDGDGLTLTQQNERYLLSRNGSRLTLVIAPAAEPLERISQLWRSL